MSTREIIRLGSDDALAEAVAVRWLDELKRAASGPAPYCVALPGGRIAKTLFTSIARHAADQGDVFQSVHFFWGDERAVPPDSDESNFALAREHLLTPLHIPGSNIHAVRGDLVNELAAILGETEVRRIVPLNPYSVPVFELAILSMGEDGHVASLFPDRVQTEEPSGRIYLPVVGPKPPPERVTMTYRTLAAARQVWVLAAGAGKEEALRESLQPEGKTPLAKLIGLRTHTHIFTDLPE